MSDWAAEAVTRGDLYVALLLLVVHLWYIARCLAFAIIGANPSRPNR